MSSYVEFYIKSEDGNKWYEYATFSRNSAVYEYISDFLYYEEGEPLTSKLLGEIINAIDAENAKYFEEVSKYNDRRSIVSQMNNTVEEKMEELYSIESMMEELQEIRNELISARGIYTMMLNLVEDREYSEEKNFTYLYAGIDWYPNNKEED